MTSSPGLRGKADSSLIIARRGVVQTTTDARKQNNTGPWTLCVGRPVIIQYSTSGIFHYRRTEIIYLKIDFIFIFTNCSV